MSTSVHTLLTTALVEADQHRAEAARLLSSATTAAPTLVAKAAAYADLALSCEQRAANLMTAFEAGIEDPVLEAAAQTASKAQSSGVA